ncbi:BEL1-like homeodomain protein 3 [Rosa rugosa]|uniref:BEL1-like homeodomain protein 3 n=1 Tax=Rosa rugosa TaxID=74645 RepID=UPI002B4089A2|nr:BEL1-like homeodomain protein 3 [Rosa rugosa]
MATYFQNLSNQNLLTPYPGDEKLASYPEQPSNMMMYMNQASYPGSYTDVLSGGSFSPNKCSESDGGRNEMMFIPPTSVPVRDCVGGDSLIGSPDGKRGIQDHGLSLSLATQIPPAVSVPSFQYQYLNSSLPSVLSTSQILGKGEFQCKGDDYSQSDEFRNFENLTSGLYDSLKTQNFSNPMCSMVPKEMHSEAYLYDSLGFSKSLLNTKYLKAAQQLLDEVVNVRKALKQSRSNKHQRTDGSKETDGIRMSSDPSEPSAVSSVELSPVERQDLQNKKTKLLSMLDEVDRRYKQYYHQMQNVVAFFDKAAGNGAAGPYTALALQAISRHFRSLHDAIKGQIQASQRSLGEKDTPSDAQGEVIPRLRYVDQQLRQQRAFQQHGVMQHSWRPQRGLPESSVAILRAWLFEHFLLPYPKDSEKVMLARQTGLTRNQVANWFINARVRLWKPMIEEMYKEEFGEEMDSKSSPENVLKEARVEFSASEDRRDELRESLISTTADSIEPGQLHDSKSGITKLQDHGQRPNADDRSVYLDANENAVATYDMSGLGNAVGSEVSLALELRHCEEHDGFPAPNGSEVRGNDPEASLDCYYGDPGQQQYSCAEFGCL